jgi:hypothetical protein
MRLISQIPEYNWYCHGFIPVLQFIQDHLEEPLKTPVIAIFCSLTLSLAVFAQQGKPSPAIRIASTAEFADAVDLKDAVKVETTKNPQLMLPMGTAIHMKLETPLNTSNNQAGDTFAGRVTEDVKLSDRIVIPLGASLEGHVVKVSEPRRIKGKPMIQLRPEFITMPNGYKCAINAAVADTNKINGTDVDDEGRIIGRTHGKRDTLELGAGAGVGAIVGGVFAGTKGSLIGAGIGAGAAVVHWASRRNSTSLPAGSEIIFELSRPVVITMNPPQTRDN